MQTSGIKSKSLDWASFDSSGQTSGAAHRIDVNKAHIPTSNVSESDISRPPRDSAMIKIGRPYSQKESIFHWIRFMNQRNGL